MSRRQVIDLSRAGGLRHGVGLITRQCYSSGRFGMISRLGSGFPRSKLLPDPFCCGRPNLCKQELHSYGVCKPDYIGLQLI